MKFKLAVLIFLWLPGIQAQEVISTAGADVSGEGGSMSFSGGQVVYTTDIGTIGSLTMGVQQPYEISVVTEIPDGPDVRLEFTTYPNPTNHFLTLRFGGVLESGYLAELYDASGKLCFEKALISNETLFDIFDLATGIYFLKLSNSCREIKTFKIIKH